jgi:hypothetical protein
MNSSPYVWLYLYLWTVPHLLLLPVAVVMFRKKLHKEYPIFFSYLLFEFLQFCILFLALHVKVKVSFYVIIDLFDRIGDAAFFFGIIQELVSAPAAHNAPMRTDMTRIVRWVTIFLVLLGSAFIGALCYSALNPGAFRPYWSVEALEAAQCGLLVLVILWHRFLGLRMSSFAFGVTLGMGLIAGINLGVLALKTSIVLSHGRVADMVSMAAYHAAVIIWLYFAQVRENVDFECRVSAPQLREQAAELGRIIHL